jgi:hypothetical protein
VEEVEIIFLDEEWDVYVTFTLLYSFGFAKTNKATKRLYIMQFFTPIS